MSVPNIDQVIDILVEKTDHSRADINKMIQETMEEMNGMVNEEGAAYVIANNLGVMINTGGSMETMTIDMLEPGKSKITILGRVSRIYGTRTFKRKDETTGKVRNIEIIDSTGSVRVALWDTRADEIEQKKISRGTVVKISGANARMGYQDRIELSVGNSSLIDPVPDADQTTFPKVDTGQRVKVSDLSALEDGTEVILEAKIVETRSEPTEFEKRDGSKGRVTSIRVSDGSGVVRVTFWDTHVEVAQKYTTGDVILLEGLTVGSSDYGKELTYRDYSSVSKVENEELAKVEVTLGSGNATQELTSLKEVENNMRNITVTGQIISIGNINSFERDGETHYVSNIVIRDHTQQRRVTLWRDQAQNVGNLAIGSVVRLENASSRYNDYSNEVELSVNNYSTITDITSEVDVSRYEQEPEFVRIGQVTETRRGVSVKVQVMRFFDINTISRDDGSQAQVLNAEVLDITDGAKARLAAWDDQMSKIEPFNEGDALILTNVSVKPSDGEYAPSITLNQYSTVEKTELEGGMPIQSAADFQNNPMHYEKTTLDNLVANSKVEVKAMIVDAYPPYIYPACPKCRKKVDMEPNATSGMCPNDGEVEPQMKMILTLVLDDSRDTCKAKLFDNLAEKLLGISAQEAQELIQRLREDRAPISNSGIEMKEIVIQGKVIEDDYSEQREKVINAEKLEFVDFVQETDDFLSKMGDTFD